MAGARIEREQYTNKWNWSQRLDSHRVSDACRRQRYTARYRHRRYTRDDNNDDDDDATKLRSLQCAPHTSRASAEIDTTQTHTRAANCNATTATPSCARKSAVLGSGCTRTRDAGRRARAREKQQPHVHTRGAGDSAVWRWWDGWQDAAAARVMVSPYVGRPHCNGLRRRQRNAPSLRPLLPPLCSAPSAPLAADTVRPLNPRFARSTCRTPAGPADADVSAAAAAAAAAICIGVVWRYVRWRCACATSCCARGLAELSRASKSPTPGTRSAGKLLPRSLLDQLAFQLQHHILLPIATRSRVHQGSQHFGPTPAHQSGIQ